MRVQLGLDASEAKSEINKLTSGIANTQKQIDKIKDTISKLTSGVKSVKLKGDFTSVKSMLQKINTETKKIAVQNIKLNIKLKAPTAKELKTQIDSLKLPDTKIGIQLKTTKTNLQKQLDKIVGNGLQIKLGAGKSGSGSGGADIKALTNSLIQLNNTIKTTIGRQGFQNNKQRQQYYDAYSKNADSRQRNSFSRQDEVQIRKDLQDATELQKAMYAARAQAELSGGRLGSTENFLDNIVLGLQERTRRGGLLNEAISNTVRNKVFQKGFNEEALKTNAFKQTGKASINNLTKKEMAQVTTEMTKSGVLGTLAKEAAGFAGVASVAVTALEKLGKAAVALGKESVQAYEGVQKLQTQLGVVYGSQAEAGAAFAGIEAYAKKSPFGVETMTSQAVLLKQSGVYSSELMDMLQRIGDISSGNNEKMKSISETYARVLASTTVTARDMRQLANAGVPVYREMAKQLGVGQNQVRSMLQAGKVKATDLTAVIKNLTNEGGTFYGATEVGAKTLAAKRQNLEDARQMGLAAIGRYLTELGPSRTTDSSKSYYSTVISLLDKIWNKIEGIFTGWNLDKELGRVEKTMQTMDSMLKIINNPNTSEESREKAQEIYNELIEKNGDLMERFISAGSQQYELKKDKFHFDGFWNIGEEGTQILKALKVTPLGFIGDALFTTQDEQNRRENLKTAHTQAQFSSNLTKNAEGLDAIIQALYGSQGLRQTATTEWKNGTLGKAYEQRDNYIRNANLRNELDAVDAKFLRNGEYDFTGVGASVKELSHAFELLAEDSEKLDLSLAGLMPDGHTFSAESQETVRFASERMNDLITATRVSARDAGLSIDDFLGEDIVNQLNDFTFALEDLSVAIPEDVDIKDIQMLGNIYETLVKTLSGSDTEAAKDTLDALQKVMTRSTLSSSGKEMLNRRKSASLWANVLGNATGIDATRITLDGRGTAMNAYRDNLSQRQMFSSIASSLLNNGSSFGEITSKLRRTGTGNDGTSLYDWRAGMAEIEQMAASKNVETQNALIGAYQSQIDTLNQLEISGLATVDSWSELEYISQGLGSAFNVTAEKLADGTYKFTDATMRAVEEMKAALNAKKLAESLRAPFLKLASENTSKGANLALDTALRAGAFGISGIPSNMYGNISNAVFEQYKNLNAADIMSSISALGLTKDELQSRLNKITQMIKNEDAKVDTVDLKTTIKTLTKDEIEELVKAEYNRMATVTSVSSDEKRGNAEATVRNSLKAQGYSVANDLSAASKTIYYGGRLGITNLTAKDIQKVFDEFEEGKISAQEFAAIMQELVSLFGEGTKAQQDLQKLILDTVETSKTLTRRENENAAITEATNARDKIAEVLGLDLTGLGEYTEPLSSVTSASSNWTWAHPGARDRLGFYGLSENLNESYAYNQLGSQFLLSGRSGTSIDDYNEDYRAMMAGYINRRYGNTLKRAATETETYTDENGEKQTVAKYGNIASLLDENGNINVTKENIGQIYEELQSISGVDLSNVALFSDVAGMSLVKDELTGLQETLADTFNTSMINMFSNSFNTLGASIYKVAKGTMDMGEAWDEVGKGIRSAAGEMLSSMGAAMAQAGFSIMAKGTKSDIALGLALVAAGGFGNFLGGWLSASAEDAADNSEQDEYERLQKMKDSLADLLKQARDDAIYYETTLRGKKAIATNDVLSTTQVHDMILTPQGQFSTDPDDYIIASKNPSALGGGSGNINPNIVVNVINTSGGQLSVERTEERRTNDGYELDVIVNGLVKDAMNNGDYDDVLQGVESRRKGYATSS